MKIQQLGKNTVLTEVTEFSLKDTLDCGQAFRWQEKEPDIWHGVAFGKYLKIGIKGSEVTFYDTDKETFESIWQDYFDLQRDYSSIISVLSQNEVLASAASFANGIRILRQEPWEALCSFIISQNNNIPRIKGIVERLCNNFGDEISDGFFSFPSVKQIASLTIDDLAVLKSGFRAKYILDAANKVANGEINLEELKNEDISKARQKLMTIYGVGEKVADCTLLFGLNKIEAFPKDVWIKKAMAKLFDGELPACATEYAGIAQQYIFHFARMTKLEI